MENIEYKYDVKPEAAQILELYQSAGLDRPLDEARIRQIYLNSKLVITAWDRHLLVGVARSITDLYYACYLSDLAVRREYQKQGIGKSLVTRTKTFVGSTTMLLILATPEAIDFYHLLGIEQINNAFKIPREH